MTLVGLPLRSFALSDSPIRRNYHYVDSDAWHCDQPRAIPSVCFDLSRSDFCSYGVCKLQQRDKFLSVDKVKGGKKATDMN